MTDGAIDNRPRDAMRPEPSARALGEVLLIGELARRCGLTTQSIRFYEREGLIAPARAGTFRVYAVSDVRRLEAILVLRRMGVSICRIREIIDVMLGPASPERDRRLGELLASHLDDLTRRQDALREEMAATSDALAKLDVPPA